MVPSPTSPDSKESTSDEVHGVNLLICKKSFLQLNPWSGIDPGIDKNNSFLFLCVRPWPLVFYPAVIYSFLVFSFNLPCLLIIVNTASPAFQSPPYNMSPGVQSLISVPGVIGAAMGAFTGGALIDQFIKWRTKKNNGIFEPEARLVALIFPLFIVPAGVLMYILFYTSKILNL